MEIRVVTVWVHKENFSQDEVLVAPDILGGDNLPAEALMEVVALKSLPVTQSTNEVAQKTPKTSSGTSLQEARDAAKDGIVELDSQSNASAFNGPEGSLDVDPRSRFYFIAKPMSPDLRANQPKLQLSVTTSIATKFGYRRSTQARISFADKEACSASHVELIFRDEYLSRSDIWRLVRSEMAGKTIYKGQKILFLGTIKAVVNQIYLHGCTTSSAYFCEDTIPVFRSQSARYVLFIQMSREMWDFDSEGTGEILFSRVIDGFLPELFKKWVDLEVRHLVSIVLFGRLEYDRNICAAPHAQRPDYSDPPSQLAGEGSRCRDFYRVVTSDMASWQWTAILDKLKQDFLVFLRDICLYRPEQQGLTGDLSDLEYQPRISGQPTPSLRGNILEAINIASSQYAGDYVDRDLVRTGVSIIVITPGTGVFQVDPQLLDTTSRNLTSNGIGVDLVCLSNMPLHSVPLFKWPKTCFQADATQPDENVTDDGSSTLAASKDTDGNCLASSPSYGSPKNSTPDKIAMDMSEWVFVIPQWVEVSYWTSGRQQTRGYEDRSMGKVGGSSKSKYAKSFLPRVRMYELQMMGVMELGLANISIPYLSEGRQSHYHDFDRQDSAMRQSDSKRFAAGHPTASSRTANAARRASAQRSGGCRLGLLSVQAQLQGDMYEWMDNYDDHLFSLRPRAKVKRPRASLGRTVSQKGHRAREPDMRLERCQRSAGDHFGPNEPDVHARKKKASAGSRQSEDLVSERRNEKTSQGPSGSRISRAISFALRGLGPTPPRAVASTEIKIENVQAKRSTSGLTPTRATGNLSKGQPNSGDDGSKRVGVSSSRSESSQLSESVYHVQPPTNHSRPISIRDIENQGQNFDEPQQGPRKPSRIIEWQDMDEETEDKLVTSSDEETEESENMYATTSPYRDCHPSPWISEVNPANPPQNQPNGSSWVGRWQHLHPRPVKASTVKWKSLCTPASLPLTTEEFPSMKDWQQQYTESSYVISPKYDHEQPDTYGSRKWLLREMIGLRLSHGYQVVVGSRLREAVGSEAAAFGKHFTSEFLRGDGVKIYMSMGSAIQRISCMNGNEIQASCFVRQHRAVSQERMQHKRYKPVMKTIFSESYLQINMEPRELAVEYPWRLADSHMAGHQNDLTEVYEQLRFWRARYVVIPFEPPAGARRPTQSRSEDNEEEVHLLGIRELTKMWQKIRYAPPEERRFKPSAGRRKDPNPLEIMLQTLNPSEVVATEIGKLLGTDEAASFRRIQLLPTSELLERSTSSLPKIAQELQSERGVEIANRRWHLRLHHSCFKGDDLTNWLLSNFKDIDSREEAVDFGNELMQHGLFQHVSTRHTFKDGNYFYMISSEHQLARSESKNAWLPSSRQSDQSVPLAENVSHLSLQGIQSHPDANSAKSPDGRTPEKLAGEKRHVSVSLTKMMRIDVDYRNPKRSDRPEIVHLHYDRLHNPENCYHLELSWLNTTSKLIDDVVVMWATQLEKYGLRLVEVPLAEANSISDVEPFREPYRLSLAVAPPSYLLDRSGDINPPTSSVNPPTAPLANKLAFHKHILKKFDFVLDLEAAADFPPEVDVKYGWGKPTYSYPQYIHRSGSLLAQVTDEGDILLVFNRLFNSRSASVKDGTGKLELVSNLRRRSAAATGILGTGTQYQTPHPSPHAGAITEGFAPRDKPKTAGMVNSVRPSMIRDEVEAFCHDAEKLKAFYREVSERGILAGRKSGSTTSSALRPVPEYGLESNIPDLRLPASVFTVSNLALKTLEAGLRKMTSPQQAGRTKSSPETPAVDFSRRASVDQH